MWTARHNLVLQAVALVALLVVPTARGDPQVVVGTRLYGLEYSWENLQFSDVDTVADSDTIWIHQLGEDSFRVRMLFYQFELPTSVADCDSFGLDAWSYYLGGEELTGLLLQLWPLDSNQAFFYYPNTFWEQWGTYQPCPGGELCYHSGPLPGYGAYNAWLLQQGCPYATTFVLGLRTYQDQAHVIDHVQLRWYSGLGAVGPPAVPGAFTVEPCYPNPFNGAVTLPLALDRPTLVAVTIYNLMGQQVATLAHGTLGAGSHRFTWQPHDQASGTYLIRVVTPSESATERIILQR